ncbi:class IV adenylate cyclase [uncultured Gimesia sp.]|uniref:class IV adenylate cyclase n=1 Tax=uncultured Gimesia sp. TaxID=1678688 RepID=UPI0030DB5706|tara:strand:+ start:109880 stop:110446 length:567 start_codon:yes stop_codon:yes gene_type:complete
MLEVEQKFLLADKDALFDQLEHLGATRGTNLEQEDLYFTHPVRNFAETDEAIRIRRNGFDNRITYKGPKRATVSKVRKEIELAFESGQLAFEQLSEMLELLGFCPLRVVRKLRIPFNYLHHQHSFEITVDEVEGLGIFVEIELLAEESELQEADAAIIQLAASLGLTHPIRASYLGMLIEQETQSDSV